MWIIQIIYFREVKNDAKRLWDKGIYETDYTNKVIKNIMKIKNYINERMLKMSNEIQVFENQHLMVFKQLAEVTKTKKQLEDQEKKIKADLEKAMDIYEIKSFENQYIKITRVNGSTSTSIDLKALGKEEPELYAELLEDYPKVTNRKSYLTFKVK